MYSVHARGAEDGLNFVSDTASWWALEQNSINKRVNLIGNKTMRPTDIFESKGWWYTFDFPRFQHFLINLNLGKSM